MLQVSIDHIVLTVTNIQATIAFYQNILNMSVIKYDQNRYALSFGMQKINLHPVKNAINPKATTPMPGSLDICFIINQPLHIFEQVLTDNKVKIIEGPVKRVGATGDLLSIYFNDPDGNLIEVSNQL